MDGRTALPLRILGRLIGLAIIIAGVATAVIVARTSSGNPRTDDAYVSANVIGIAPHVQGPLVQLNVVDNQPVEANDLLFVIDPRPYEAELQRAQGELIVAQAEVSGIEQAIAAGRAEVTGCRRTRLMRAAMPAGWNRSSAAALSAPTNIKRRSPRPGRSTPRFSTRSRSWRSSKSCWRSKVTLMDDWRRPRRASGCPS
jgi:multidrug resistance efflux pump